MSQQLHIDRDLKRNCTMRLYIVNTCCVPDTMTMYMAIIVPCYRVAALRCKCALHPHNAIALYNRNNNPTFEIKTTIATSQFI